MAEYVRLRSADSGVFFAGLAMWLFASAHSADTLAASQFRGFCGDGDCKKTAFFQVDRSSGIGGCGTVSGDLLAQMYGGARHAERLGAGTVLLCGFALDDADALIDEIHRIAERAPFRHMQTASGLRMSVAMSNCGSLGWISDAAGYRYVAIDPASGLAWPPMPPLFLQLAGRAAEAAGFPGFVPDACLINRYQPGARMGLHHDKDERDLGQPIVSVSLGLPAIFQWGGQTRRDTSHKLTLEHGDVLVWGGADRLRYHGVQPIRPGEHPQAGACRLNLTFRKAG